ncbi:ATP-grasp enzyme [Amycolatopsis sp. PS_44_ISF1]|uniref:ATP-grasp enzyme n=1 Tax=Amycolatopsis sp. PS_44_ISF1 TaxID=2974917 RepID=UPI0028DF719C|nr:ATP-grasp enzyme [Amycolatopsis sp. PS_44_ISF1]MDT8914745.1 ATP-grasp enzyme [Amycolatopsis sp. PS_44_ISF1]
MRTNPPVGPGKLRTASKTLGTLALLQLVLPVNLVLTAVALVWPRRDAPAAAAPGTSSKTILISGGKMTKALQLARSMHRAGHRVILVETARYRLTGHRFSRAVDRFRTVPPPTAPGYAQALLDIVLAEGVDVYIPVCSPVSSYYDALAKPLLEPHCTVLHPEAEVVRALDDKYEFTRMARAAGLSTPDSHRVTEARQVTEFDFAAGQRPYLLKSIAYDPVNRLDLTTLPRPTRPETAAHARSKPISPRNPWIMQEFIAGQEYCVHTTVRDGEIKVYVCCASSAFQVNYARSDHPGIEAWVRRFASFHRLTGQISFDLIQAEDGRVFPIECNPRTHSAITLFRDHPGLAPAYLDPGAPPVTPRPDSRPTYWTYHELWRLLRRQRGLREGLRVFARGTDAIFDRSDPLPFLLVHHVQIPGLLLRNLVTGRDWHRIDFNIGKLVEPAGD